jgi:hypothetical protein
MLKRAQEIGALEESLYGEAIGFVGLLFPAGEKATSRIPGDAVPIVQKVRDIEKLR